MTGTTRAISRDERSGVLSPHNLPRFDARWIEPDPSLRDVVDTYWSVEWNLSDGVSVRQPVLEFPAVTLSIETGSVPAPFVITAPQRRAWVRTIEGSGRVFVVRLRPAGLSVVSDASVLGSAPERALTRATDPVAVAMLEDVTNSSADLALSRMLHRRPLSPEGLLANRVVDALSAEVRSRTGASLAREVGAGERAIQRALARTLGMGPKAVARRIRLQEVVRLLSRPGAVVADVAAELGYVDQAHLINDFRGVAGTTPGAYVSALNDGILDT